jgi:hypothetical protein
MRRRIPLPSLATILAVPALLVLAGCGGGGYYDPHPGTPYPPASVYGSTEVDNLSAEYVDGFYLAPSYTSDFTGDLLSGPLPPGFYEYVGDFLEDSYDAEADLEYGDLVQWFDVFVPGDQLTTFEVY